MALLIISQPQDARQADSVGAKVLLNVDTSTSLTLAQV